MKRFKKLLFIRNIGSELNEEGVITETKVCSICGKEKELSEFYSQKKYTKKRGDYIYYEPYCKSCSSKKSWDWRLSHEDKFKEAQVRYRKTKKYRARVKAMNEKYKEYNQQWRKDNAEYFREFNKNRDLHKHQKITENELNELYEYADACCMYCGITEEEHKKTQGQRLHRDHAINNGSNGIDNCVLACRPCNSSKWNRDWDEWYTPDNPVYTYERYLKIKKWLDSFK